MFSAGSNGDIIWNKNLHFYAYMLMQRSTLHKDSDIKIKDKSLLEPHS